jgi:prepilin-type processing-associated H-X9-DG protein
VPFDGNPLAPRTEGNQWERHFKGKYSKQLTVLFEPSTSNYVGSWGFVDRPCMALGSNVTVLNWVGDPAECTGNGVFQGLGPIGLKEISDGTSSTFLLGERDSFCLSATWIGMRNPPGPDSWGAGWVLGRVSLKLNHPETGAHNTCTEGFSSKHAGGANFAFCDASVDFISDDIEYNDAKNARDSYVDPPSGVGPEKLFMSVRDGVAIGAYQRLGVRNDELPVNY